MTRAFPHPRLLTKDFAGCIRHVTNDQTMYDLESPSNANGSKRGCPVMDQHCVAHTCSAPSKCVPSWSGHACLCPLGFAGSTCEQGVWFHLCSFGLLAFFLLLFFLFFIFFYTYGCKLLFSLIILYILIQLP